MNTHQKSTHHKKTALVCFAKNPIHNHYKTRLQSELGLIKTREIYFKLIHIIENLFSEIQINLPNCTGFFAVDQLPFDSEFKLGERWPIFLQKGETLAEKLFQAQDLLNQGFDQIIFIGTDAPSLTVKIINLVISALNESTHCLAKACDGGFYLYGSQIYCPLSFWQAVEYSQDTTCQQLAGQIQNNADYSLDLHFPLLSDLDTAFDLKSCLIDLNNNLPDLSPAQLQFRAYLQSFL